MSHSHPVIRPQDVFGTLARHKLLLGAPIVVLTSLAVAYALLRPATWEASQALIVRSESSDVLAHAGRASQLEQMKNTQEIILELAKSRSVLINAMKEVGPGADDSAAIWPDEKALEALQQSVAVEAPKGAEFGKTEMFYLKVKDHERSRAASLAAAIGSQLQDRLAALHKSTSKGSIDELSHSVSMARDELNTATASLRDMERQVGHNLAELRIMTENPSGDSDLRRNLVELEKELRTYKAEQLENQQSLELLQQAQHDPEKLLASPQSLLSSQPALARLKDGLVDAQLRSGQVRGTMSDEHPLVQGAREAERVIRNQLHDEIKLAIKGVQSELQVEAARIAAVQEDMAEVQERLTTLADMRAEYANLSAAVKNRGETLKTVEQELAEAHSRHAAAVSTSRLSLVDKPDTGTRPIGPGRSVIALAGLGGGLLVSAALAFLLIQPAGAPQTGADVEPVAEVEAAPQPVAEPVEPPTLRLAGDEDTKPRGPLTLGQALQRVAG